LREEIRGLRTSKENPGGTEKRKKKEMSLVVGKITEETETPRKVQKNHKGEESSQRPTGGGGIRGMIFIEGDFPEPQMVLKRSFRKKILRSRDEIKNLLWEVHGQGASRPSRGGCFRKVRKEQL